MKNTLHLTADERVMFDALPEDVREGWEVEEEIGTAYEDADVLRIRAGMARFESFPALHDVVRRIVQTGSVDEMLLLHMPDGVLPELCFTIGARGVTALVRALLNVVQNDDDLAGLAGLSRIRHDILKTNASISYA